MTHHVTEHLLNHEFLVIYLCSCLQIKVLTFYSYFAVCFVGMRFIVKLYGIQISCTQATQSTQQISSGRAFLTAPVQQIMLQSDTNPLGFMTCIYFLYLLLAFQKCLARMPCLSSTIFFNIAIPISVDRKHKLFVTEERTPLLVTLNRVCVSHTHLQ